MTVVRHFQDIFGHGSILKNNLSKSLKNNLSKSSVSPIHCSEEELTLIAGDLSCSFKNFP
jgi:hypothetical protein